MLKYQWTCTRTDRAAAAEQACAGSKKPAPEEPVGVGVAGDFLVALGAHDLLDLRVDEVVEAVDVLPHQAAHLCGACAKPLPAGSAHMHA
jgi:hypothetical protein